MIFSNRQLNILIFSKIIIITIQTIKGRGREEKGRERKKAGTKKAGRKRAGRKKAEEKKAGIIRMLIKV